MLFTSLQYAIFLSLAVIMYYALPAKYRWVFLLAASYTFYMFWNAAFALLMFFTTITSFFAAKLINKALDRKSKRVILVSVLVLNLGILFLFKYFNFFNQTVAGAMKLFGLNVRPLALSLLLPVGISFYTFQALGAVFDVYTGKAEPARHFGKYALFVSFFPQIAAGPIARIENLLPQFDRDNRFNFDNFKTGLLFIVQGLFKKIVIADRLAILVNSVFDSPEKHNGIHFAIAAVFFSFQIYCDFSGYSDIAVGSAKLIGYDLTQNFRGPYMASSVADFWRRWHISLTSWFRDYVYIPLGGNRKKHLRNIFIVFLLSGLWHGTSLTFVIWGALNGIYQIIGLKLKPLCTKVKALLKIDESTFTFTTFKKIFTFMLVCFAWIFFRANSLGDLKIILARLFAFNFSFFSGLSFESLGIGVYDFLVSTALILFLLFFESRQEKKDMAALLRREPIVARWFVYIFMFVIILVFGVYGDANSTQFIYFKF